MVSFNDIYNIIDEIIDVLNYQEKCENRKDKIDYIINNKNIKIIKYPIIDALDILIFNKKVLLNKL